MINVHIHGLCTGSHFQSCCLVVDIPSISLVFVVGCAGRQMFPQYPCLSPQPRTWQPCYKEVSTQWRSTRTLHQLLSQLGSCSYSHSKLKHYPILYIPLQPDNNDHLNISSLHHMTVGTVSLLVQLLFVCLFDLILYVPSTIFQLNRDGSSWVEPVLS